MWEFEDGVVARVPEKETIRKKVFFYFYHDIFFVENYDVDREFHGEGVDAETSFEEERVGGFLTHKAEIFFF